MLVLYGADQPMVGRVLRNFDCVHLPRTAAVGRAESPVASVPSHSIAAE
jgi:hypothetical protein